MRKLVLALVTVFLVSCGKSDDSHQISGTDRDAFMSSCTNAIGDVTTATLNYCNCVLNALLSQYTVQQIQNMGAYTAGLQLIDNGTVKSCASQAGILAIPTPTPTPTSSN